MTLDRAGVWRLVRIAALVVVTCVLAFALRTVNWTRTGDALRQGSVTWLAVAIAANTAILFCWAAFWQRLRPSDSATISYSRTLEIVSVASSLMNTVPFGGGHASTAVLLVKRGGLTTRNALSLLALDQLGEGVVKVAILLFAALLAPLPVWMKVGVSSMAAVVGVWFATLAVASRWRHELAILRSWRRAGVALGCVAAMKLMQLAAVMAVQHAYRIDIGAADSLLVLAAILLASIPVSPGNLGTYEAAAFLVYRHLGIPPETALSVAIVQHACFMLPAVGVGYSVFSARTFSRSAIAS